MESVPIPSRQERQGITRQQERQSEVWVLRVDDYSQ